MSSEEYVILSVRQIFAFSLDQKHQIYEKRAYRLINYLILNLNIEAKLLTGTVVYNVGDTQVFGSGIYITQGDLDSILRGPVAEIVFDDEGTGNIIALIESIPDTDFNPESVRQILTSQTIPEDWRIGEAIAEAYLVHNLLCYFPWPDSRDERKRGSSLPGADLVGFHRNGTTYRFVFGEVKTSSQEQYPPNLVYGRSGLNAQLESLKTDQTVRDGLVTYLAHRAVHATWEDLFKEAFCRYMIDNTDVQVYGFLIRDVTPHRNDLYNRVNALRHNCPPPMCFTLLAIYLPAGSISSLGTVIMETRQRSNT